MDSPTPNETSPDSTKSKTEKLRKHTSLRNASLGFLFLITIGVAVFSAKVSFDILNGPFGDWAFLIVGSLDSVWLLLVAAEYAAGNNRKRALPVQVAGLVITGVVAAIPTVEMVIGKLNSGNVGVEVALTPIAIVVTKVSWIFLLGSFGRHISPETRTEINRRRQEVMDQLEISEAEAAHEVEILEVLSAQEERKAKAQAEYRRAILKVREEEMKTLHAAGLSFSETRKNMPMPKSAVEIDVPTLSDWMDKAAAQISIEQSEPLALSATPSAPAEIPDPPKPRNEPAGFIKRPQPVHAAGSKKRNVISFPVDGLTEGEKNRKKLATLWYAEEDNAAAEGRSAISQAEFARRQGVSSSQVTKAKDEWSRKRLANPDQKDVTKAS